MKFFKNSLKNFSITQSTSATNQLTRRINLSKKSNRQFLKLKTNYTDDFIGITNKLSNNFKIRNTSQIYNNPQDSTYQGYIELESSLNENVLKNLLDNMIQEYGIEEASASYELVGEIPARNNSKENKRISLLNSNTFNVSSIVSAKLYQKTTSNKDGDLSNFNLERNQDFGLVLDKVKVFINLVS